jgi:hypothetical protein
MRLSAAIATLLAAAAFFGMWPLHWTFGRGGEQFVALIALGLVILGPVAIFWIGRPRILPPLAVGAYVVGLGMVLGWAMFAVSYGVLDYGHPKDAEKAKMVAVSGLFFCGVLTLLICMLIASLRLAFIIRNDEKSSF